MGSEANHQLSQTLYAQLRRIAAGHLRRERSGHSLQPTALVHEVFLKLWDQQNLKREQRPALLAIAARQMRQVLIDHARHRNRLKRGGKNQRLTIDSQMLADSTTHTADLMDLTDALERLAALSPRQAEVVTLRFFGGMTNPELSEAIGVSLRTVEADWQFARAWLRRELGKERV